MTAEQIIKTKTSELSQRREELLTLYGSDGTAIDGGFLLEEAALIELELKNRGFTLQWQKEDTV